MTDSLERLERLIADIKAIQSKLVLLIGKPGIGKTSTIRCLADRHGAEVLNIGRLMGARLAVMPIRQRGLEANVILRVLADEFASGDLLFIDNLELLFDQTLKLDPLDLLKRLAHARRVAAVWPGDMRNGRLSYAEMGHPEYREYGMDGFVPFVIDAVD